MDCNEHAAKKSRRAVRFGCLSVVVLLFVAIVWFLSNATLLFSKLLPFAGARCYSDWNEMNSACSSGMGPAGWFAGIKIVPSDARDIAFVGETSWEGAGPWHARMTCRTSEEAFLRLAADNSYALATNGFHNVISADQGGMDSAGDFVQYLPDLIALCMTRNYITYTSLTTSVKGKVMLFDRDTGKLYCRTISRWR